jgi:hypothetical protein
MLMRVGDPSSFIALGSRGLFVYDWTDVHRTVAAAIGAYELVAIPDMPIGFDELPVALRRMGAQLSSGALIGASTVSVGK